MSTIATSASASAAVNGIANLGAVEIVEIKAFDEKISINVADDRWENAKTEALNSWRSGSKNSWKFVIACGNALAFRKDSAPLEWALEMSESTDPVIKTAAKKSCSIIEGLYFGSQKKSGGFEVDAAAPALGKREIKEFVNRADYWRVRREMVADAWNGSVSCRRAITHKTDMEKLNAAAKIIAKLIEGKKITAQQASEAIEAARVELRAKTKK